MPPNGEWGLGSGDDIYENDPDIPPYAASQGSDGVGGSVPRPRLAEHPGISLDATALNSMNHSDDEFDKGRSVKWVGGEHIQTFDDGYDGITGVDDSIAESRAAKWDSAAGDLNKIGSSLREAPDKFADKLKGMTFAKISRQLEELAKAMGAASRASTRMARVSDMFAQDLVATKSWFAERKAKLDDSFEEAKLYDGLASHGVGSGGDSFRKAAVEKANADAIAHIRTFYNPPIVMIGRNHPDVGAEPTGVDPGAPGSPATGGPTSSPSAPPRTLGDPALSAPWSDPASTPAPASSNPAKTPSDAVKGLSDAAKQAGDAGKQAGQGLQQAGQGLQQAAGAGQKSLSDALNRASKAGPPEGALNLAPGSSASAKSPPVGGSRPVGGQSTTAPRPATAVPVTGTRANAQSVPGAKTSGASLSSGGSPGAGAPAAGSRPGGAGGEKIHQVTKALRNRKQGEALVQADGAVVPVVGAPVSGKENGEGG